MAFVQDIYHIRYLLFFFLQKKNLVLRSILSEGRFFREGGGSQLSGFANTCDILLLLSEGSLLSRVVTFGTLRYRLLLQSGS